MINKVLLFFQILFPWMKRSYQYLGGGGGEKNDNELEY